MCMGLCLYSNLSCVIGHMRLDAMAERRGKDATGLRQAFMTIAEDEKRCAVEGYRLYDRIAHLACLQSRADQCPRIPIPALTLQSRSGLLHNAVTGIRAQTGSPLFLMLLFTLQLSGGAPLAKPQGSAGFAVCVRPVHPEYARCTVPPSGCACAAYCCRCAGSAPRCSRF